MSASLVAAGTFTGQAAQANTGTAITHGLTLVAGDVLVVAGNMYNQDLGTGTVAGITITNITMASVKEQAYGPSDRARTYIWAGLVASSPGSTYTVTFGDATGNYNDVQMLQFRGLQTSFNDQNGSNTAASNATSITGTCSGANSVARGAGVVVAGVDESSIAALGLSAPSGWIQRGVQNDSTASPFMGCFVGTRIYTSGETSSAAFTGIDSTNNGLGVCVATFKELLSVVLLIAQQH